MPTVLAPRKTGKGMQANLNVRVNMQGWWRFHVALTNINGACSSWNDQSGNMNHLVQPTASLRPTINSDGSLTFNGSSQYLSAAFTLVQPATIYLAFRQLTWSSGAGIFDGKTGVAKVTQKTTSPQLALDAGSALTNDGTIALNQNGVIACVFSAGSSVYQAAGGAASVTTTGSASTGNPGGITLGALQAPGNYSNITVYEMIAYSVAHDATTRLQILRYLGRIANVGGIT